MKVPWIVIMDGKTWVSWAPIPACHQSLYSLSRWTSYHKSSWSLEAVRFRFWCFQSLWYLWDSAAAVLPRCLSNFRVIWPVLHPILQLYDFTRFGGKMSYPLVTRGSGWPCSSPPIIQSLPPAIWPIIYCLEYRAGSAGIYRVPRETKCHWYHYYNVTWVLWHLRSLATSLFVKQLVHITIC